MTTLFCQEYTPSYDQDLFRSMNNISGCYSTFTINEPARVFITGHVETNHRGLVNGAVMVAFKIKVNGSWLSGSTTGQNIRDETDHYAVNPVYGYVELPAGDHVIELHGRSASSLAPGSDGLAEVRGNYSAMLVKAESM